MTTHMPLTQLGDITINPILRRTFIYLIVLHQQFADLVFQDTDPLVVALVYHSRVQVLLCLLKVLLVLGVDGRQQGKADALPKFLHVEQHDDPLLLILQLFDVLLTNKGLETFEDRLGEVRHEVMDVRFEEIVLATLFVVTDILLRLAPTLLTSVILVVFVAIGLLENVDLALRRLAVQRIEDVALDKVTVLPHTLVKNSHLVTIVELELVVAHGLVGLSRIKLLLNIIGLLKYGLRRLFYHRLFFLLNIPADILFYKPPIALQFVFNLILPGLQRPFLLADYDLVQISRKDINFAIF
jgi:hypothetical protein